MRMRSRKKKDQFDSQIDIQAQLQPRPFVDESQATNRQKDLQNHQEIAPQSGFNFADVPIFPEKRSQNILPNTLPIQPKLTIGAPGDKYEQEADAVANQVVNQINSPQGVQREIISEGEEDTVQAKPVTSFFNNLVQRKPDGGGLATPQLETSINQAQGKGESLSEGIKQPMERAFGADFSGVKVHTDAESNQLNQSIQAKAFTTGQDIFFKQGAYDPASRSGQTLIAHELTHVVQQNGSGIQRQLVIQREPDDIPSQPQQRADELARLIIGQRATDKNTILKIKGLLSGGDLGTIKFLFSQQAARRMTIEEAIESTFSRHEGAKEYLLRVCAGQSESLIPQLIIASGLSGLSIGKDPQEMVALIEYASPQELRELNELDGGRFKEKILKQFTKFGRHHDKKQYVKAIIEGNELGSIRLLEELNSPEDLLADENILAKKNLKKRELISLFNILRGAARNYRIAKKLTTPEAEERIMQWAARQTPAARQYIASKRGLADRYLSNAENDIPDGYRQHILNLIKLDYGAYQPEKFNTKKERQEHVNELVAEQQPKALVSYLLNKKQRFGHGIGNSQAQVLGGGVLGYWDGFAKRIENLTLQGRLDFLKELFEQSEGNANEFTRETALEELQKILTSIGGNQNKEAFQRMLNAFKAEATQNTPERRSTPNLLRILVERWFISGNRLQFTSRDAVELVSKLQPSEYLEVIRNKDLLTKLKAIVRAQEWQRISEILGLQKWCDLNPQEATGTAEEIPEIPLDEQNIEQIERNRALATNIIELRPEHWAAKLSHELEKGYLAIHIISYSAIGSAWDRNRVFSLVQQAYNAGERKTEQDGNGEVLAFMNDVMAKLTPKATQVLNNERLAPAKEALERGRQISAEERIQGATFRESSIFKRWLRGRGMRQRSLLNAIMDVQGEDLLDWSNFDQLENTIKELKALADDDIVAKEAKIASIKAFKLDLKPEFRQDLEYELPASEFEELYSTLLYKLANALEKDEVVKEVIGEITAGGNVPDELQDLEVTAELLRFKALKEAESLNQSGIQWDWFSSKGAQRGEAMAGLEGKVASVNEQLKTGRTIDIADKKQLTQARKKAEGKKARFMEMRETAKKTTLRCVGLLLAVACTLATGGLASVGVTGIGVSVALSAARALVLQGVSVALEGKGYNPWEGLLFEIIKDSALAATTFGAGELSKFIESADTPTLAKAAKGNGKFAEALGSNFGNISPIEATLRTITGSSLEAATSADHQDWYEKKSGIFWNTLITALKDSLSKSVFDMLKEEGDFGTDQIQENQGSIFEQLSGKQLGYWVLSEVFTGQNIAVCEMSTLQDGHINLLSNKLATLINQAAVAQRSLELEEDPSSAPAKKLRRRQGIGKVKRKRLKTSALVNRNEQESDLRNNDDVANIATQWLDNKHDVDEKIEFLTEQLGASVDQCLALGYTPKQLLSYFPLNEIDRAGNQLIEQGKIGNSIEFRKQLLGALNTSKQINKENAEDLIPSMVNDRSTFKAYKNDLLMLGVVGGKWADHYEIQAVARGLGQQIQLHRLKNNAVISTDRYGQGDPACHLVIENDYHYGALQLNPTGNITIGGQRYEHIDVKASGDCFYDALSRVSGQAVLVLRQMAFNNMTLGDVRQSIQSVLFNLSIGEQLGVGRNMKALYQQKLSSQSE